MFDIFFSLGILVLGSPVFLIISIAVKFTSKGPIFYCSKRIGLKGKIIYCMKFRTMFDNAESSLLSILAKDPMLQQEWDRFQKLKKDPRITKLGHFLRKTSLDELPQFFNSLKGDLSVVGPRPLSKEEITKYYGKKIEKMLSVRPGITGLSQTVGRNNLTLKQRIELEQIYIDTQSFIIDFILILKTVPQMFFCKGAF